MKTFILKLTLLIPFILFGQVEKTVLFIGNSYTNVNNLPDLIQQIAIDKGNQFVYETHTPGGSTLSQHSTNSNVQYLLGSTQWDYVVLQEQSQFPSFPPSQVATGVYPYAESLCNDIRFNSPCAEPVFFMTWGRENGDSQNCAYYPPICTYTGMQERLIESYTEMAESNNALLAPVGIAWQNIRASHPEIDLYSSDGSHPSIYGSYLAACVFYSVLFSDEPNTEYIPVGITTSEAEIIQEFALNTVSETTTDYSLQVEALASYEMLDDKIYFFNESINASSINWAGLSQDITSSEDTLIVTLNGYTGLYEIMLIADNGCTSSELLIQINNLDISDTKSDYTIYPNPSQGMLRLENSDLNIKSIFIYNQLGRCVYTELNSNAKEFNLNFLPGGVYQIIIQSEKAVSHTFSWIKKN